MSRGIPVITFHSLDDSDSTVATPPSRFAAQVQRLAAAGWKGVAVGRVLDWSRGVGELPAAALGICFDDGYRSVYDVALPTLRRYGFTATVFVVTGRCGDDNRWPGQPAAIPERSLLDWEELGSLLDAGWEVGAHTVTHAPLVGLSDDRLAAEVEGSRDALERRLGVTDALFAYPYGVYDEAARGAVEDAFRGACGVSLGWVRPGTDGYDLPRIDAYYLRNRSWLAALGSVRGRTRLWLRGWARRLKPRRDWQAE